MRQITAGILLILSILALFLLLSPTPSSSPAATPEDLGLMLGEESSGLRILAVAEHSAADLAGLCPGDLIVSGNGQSLHDTQTLSGMLLSSSQDLALTYREEKTDLERTIMLNTD